eukprot:889422-Rhodomonas_salina.1
MVQHTVQQTVQHTVSDSVLRAENLSPFHSHHFLMQASTPTFLRICLQQKGFNINKRERYHTHFNKAVTDIEGIEAQHPLSRAFNGDGDA